MMKLLTICLLLLITVPAYCRSKASKVIGRYACSYIVLEIRPDSTFSLSAPDIIYPFTYKTYGNEGTWAIVDNMIVLNPEKEKRRPEVRLVEKIIAGTDSVRIRVNYETRYFEKEVYIRTERTEMPILTLYINRRKNYHHLVHQQIIRNCSFATRVRRQYVTDSSNTLTLAKQPVDKIGVFTYGFESPVEFAISDPNANYFEINITQPVDVERTPRARKVIIRGNRAYFDEWNGRVQTGVFAVPLNRVKNKRATTSVNAR